MTRLRRLAILAVVAVFTLTIALPVDARTYHAASATCSGLDGAQGTYYIKNLTSSSRTFPKFGMYVRIWDATRMHLEYESYRPTYHMTVGAGKTVKVWTSNQYYSGKYTFSASVPGDQLTIWSVTVTARCVR